MNSDLTYEDKPMYRKDLSLSNYALREEYVQRCMLGAKGYAELYLKRDGYGLDNTMYVVKGFSHKLKFFFKEFPTRAEADKYWRQLRRNAKQGI